MNSCSFFGHRDIIVTKELKEKLKTLIEDLIKNKEFNIFYFGEFGDFDDLCYEVVLELKSVYPQVEMIYVATDEKALTKHKKNGLKFYDNETVFTLSFTWWYQIIYYRNLAIIDNSDYVIFFVSNTKNSGAYKALQYAEKAKKQFFNIAKS